MRPDVPPPAPAVLMVDDEPANLLALEAILQPLGPRIVQARSAAQALRALLDDDFAAILLDVRMPDMSGFEAAALIRRRPRSHRTPILFLTGSEKSADAMFEGYSAGAVDYLMKPVVPEVLRSKVGFFIELAQARQALEQQVHEREQAAEELRRLNVLLQTRQAELVAANRELDAFCASVAHDLRNPLSQIVGFAQLLLDRSVPKLDADERQQLQIVHDVGLRMSQMITDFLNFARIEHVQMAPRSVDMDALMRTVVADLQAGWQGAAAGPVEWHLGTLPPAMGDMRMLRQVWTNLLSNALKYSRGRAAPCIEVSGEEQGRELVYRVTDNGVGFDPKQAGRLFTAFARLHSGNEFEGIGIGLSSVKRIVERHGGRVWAEARPGGPGARFSFALPSQALQDALQSSVQKEAGAEAPAPVHPAP